MVITNSEELKNVDGNKFIGSLPKLNSSRILFNGVNNIFVCEDGVEINNSTISFNGNNSIVFLNKSHKPYRIELAVSNNSVVYFGEKNFFASQLKIICSEAKHIFVGDGNLFSHGISIRNADAHLIYDTNTKKRINFSKSVFIGDHVWIGQATMILKGSKIHSGSIIGANSVVTKEIESNVTYAGAPLKFLKKNVFWQWDCVHDWTEKETLENLYCEKTDSIYEYSENENISFDEIDKNLTNLSLEEKLEFLAKISKNKNRFSK